MSYYILIRTVDVCAERPLPHQLKPDVADVRQLLTWEEMATKLVKLTLGWELLIHFME